MNSVNLASSTSGSHCWGETYTLDQWANMTGIGALSGYTGCTQEGLSVSPTGNNQLSATGITYDASGNTLTDGTNTYVWDAESQIKTGANVNYFYNGDGERIRKGTGKSYWLGPSGEILDESDATGDITYEYVFFGGKRIAMRNVYNTGDIYYYAEDMLGSSRTLVEAGGTSVCYDADFYPYGGKRDITDTCAQYYKFEGKERDAETGNDEFGARYYTSRLGRWLSADWSAAPAPVPYANLTNPQTLNLYAMVRDDPETFADLDGHALDCSGSNAQGAGCQAKAQWDAQHLIGTQSVTLVGATGAIHQTTTSTRDSQGNTTTTVTTTTAMFSNEPGHEGEYIGATQTTTSWTTDKSGDTSDVHSSTRSIEQKVAAGIIGDVATIRAQGNAASASHMRYFGMITGQDMKAHPGKYVFAGLEIATALTPLPEAYAAWETVKAWIDVDAAAGDFDYEVLPATGGSWQ